MPTLPALDPDLTTDRALDRYAMAHDASHYLLIPELVVRPTSTEQVAQVMAACAAAAAPITFRAGGTSLSGQSLSNSVLVDVRRGFTGVEVLDGGARVRVRPGTTIGMVNAHLAPYRRRLGPDPASESACTVGGVVANNSSGMQCGTEFNSYATVAALTFVLPSGTIIDSGAQDAAATFRDREPELARGLEHLRDRVRDNPDSVSRLRHLFSMKNTMGYGLNAFLDFDDPLDILVHLLIGSEGTLAFLAEVVFTTVPIRPLAATSLLVFPDLHSATSSVPALNETGTATVELLDAASLRVAKADSRSPQQIRELQIADHAALLVEYQSDDDAQLDAQVEAARPALAGLALSAAPELTRDPALRAQMWATRKGLFSAVAGARPRGFNALLEDVVVPVPDLGDTCVALTELFERHSYQESVIFGHARDGNVHFMLNEIFNDEAKLRRYEAFTMDMVDLVLGRGGSLKAEHGTGRIMAPFVRRQYGDELTEVMWQLKRLCDPTGLLNPDTVLSDDDDLYLRDLKPSATVEEEVDRCVECGFCEPVCPSRNLTLTPRQRIVIRRELDKARAAGDLELVEALTQDYEYAGIQTCAVDGRCVTACPVHINTGDLVRRLRHEQESPLARKGWQAAAGAWRVVPQLASAGLDVAAALPTGLPSRVTGWARKLLGTDVVPQYSEDIPAGGVGGPSVQDPDPEVVLFGACIGAMFGSEEPSAAHAFATLCARAGVQIRTVDTPGLCCGVPWKSKGHQTGYDVMKRRVLGELLTATDGGRLPLVCDASSCFEGLALMLETAGSPVHPQDAVTFTATHLLDRLTITNPVGSVMIHPTCATEQAGTMADVHAVAEACAGQVLVPKAWGCCAFAGDRGLLHPELTASATAAEAAEVNQHEYDAYVSSNRTCELGMTRATGRRYRHVLQLLEECTRD